LSSTLYTKLDELTLKKYPPSPTLNRKFIVNMTGGILHKKALELLQRLLGEEHPHVAASYNNLAGLYSDQGRYSKAEPL